MASLLAEERSAMNKILCPDASDQPVLVDVWREKHPTEEEYTYVVCIHLLQGRGN